MIQTAKKNLSMLLLIAIFVPIHINCASYILPYNRDIGQLVEPEAASIEAYAENALSSAYSPEWVATYIPPSLQVGFVHTYDGLLSDLLPAKAIQMGKAVERTQLWEVGFVVTEPTYRWGSMVWIAQDDGRWALLSISVSE